MVLHTPEGSGDESSDEVPVEALRGAAMEAAAREAEGATQARVDQARDEDILGESSEEEPQMQGGPASALGQPPGSAGDGEDEEDEEVISQPYHAHSKSTRPPSSPRTALPLPPLCTPSSNPAPPPCRPPSTPRLM